MEDWLADLNPNSKIVISEAFAVPILKDAKLGDRFQFERLGKWICLETTVFLLQYEYIDSFVCVMYAHIHQCCSYPPVYAHATALLHRRT